MSENSKIWVSVITEETVTEKIAVGKRAGEDIGGGFGPPERIAETVKKILTRKRVSLDARILREQMSGLLTVVSDLFEQASLQEQMKLEELELSVEVDGEGQVNLVGNSVALGNKGGITMKFTAK